MSSTDVQGSGSANAGWLVAGVDCSTQATKVLVVDPEHGRVVAAGRATHWDARRGTTVEPPDEADRETLERIRAVREAAGALLDPSG